MGISERWQQSLEYFRWKLDHNVSDSAFDSLRKMTAKQGLDIFDLRSIRSYLVDQLRIERRRYDCCPMGCMAYIKECAEMRECPYCKTPRYHQSPDLVEVALRRNAAFSELTSRGHYDYIPLKERLRLLYATPHVAKKMRYAADLRETKNEEVLRDVWDARVMNHWANLSPPVYPLSLI